MGLNPTTAGTLPVGFQDKLQTEMLLQPDSEFVLARWAFAAMLAAQMQSEDGFDLAMEQIKAGRLGPMGDAANMEAAMSGGMGGPLLLSQGMLFPDFVTMVKEAKTPGDNIKIPRPRFIDGATTEASRKLGPNTKMFGTTSQGPGMDEVAVQIFEYGGPGDANGALSPVALARFAQHRSVYDLLKYIGLQLRRDRYKFVDDQFYRRLIAGCGANATGTTRGGGVASNAAFTGVGNEPLSFEVCLNATEAMRGRKVPGVTGIGGGKYVLLADHHAITQLKMDPVYRGSGDFHREFNVLFPGYVKTVEDLIICVSNRIPRLSNIGAPGNLTGYQSLLLAPGALGWASAMDAMVIRNGNDDGGRFSEWGWIAYEGFQTLDDAFAQLIITV